MSIDAPKIDPRDYNKLLEQTKTLLISYAGGWKPADKTPGSALVQAFARLAEIVVERVNRIPEKNFLAFLEMLGLEINPPQPARVPLTFYLAQGRKDTALVPQGTQVAAPPPVGTSEPIIFETERDLVLTGTIVRAAFARYVATDSRPDAYADYSEQVAGANLAQSLSTETQKTDNVIKPFQNDAGTPIPRQLYVGLGSQLAQATGTLTLTLDGKDARALLDRAEWDYRDDKGWQPLPSPKVFTREFNEVTFAGVTFAEFPAIPESIVHGRTNLWLRMRLQPAQQPPANGFQAGSVSISLRADELHPSVGPAFTNQQPIDLNKGFFPFGEQPRLDDALYLACEEAFTHADASVRLEIKLVQSTFPDEKLVGSETISAAKETLDALDLAWEYWNQLTQRWTTIKDLSGKDGPLKLTGLELKELSGKDGPPKQTKLEYTATFSVPKDMGPVAVNGIQSCWIRSRISSGGYGLPASYQLKDIDNLSKGYYLRPACYAAPRIESFKVSYTPAGREARPPDCLLEDNNFRVTEVLPDRTLFQPLNSEDSGFYLGFDWPDVRARFAAAQASYIEANAGTSSTAITAAKAQLDETRTAYDRPAFANLPAAIYFRPAEAAVACKSVGLPEPDKIAWEYWGGDERWLELNTHDETRGLTRRGMVSFTGPADFRRSNEFGQDLFWLRMRWSGASPETPKIAQLRLNTIWATQAQTIENEVLGSGTGLPSQTLHLSKTPVLPGQVIQVCEAEPPPAERTTLEAMLGPNAIIPIVDPEPPVRTRQPSEVWVRWQQVSHFYGSGPRSRHYVLDRLTGEIRFGDGQRGMAPPAGRSNVRAVAYRAGGGPAGNLPPGAITELKTTVPYVDRVENAEAAQGGLAVETLDNLRVRGPRTLRHRDRAVAGPDFKDLALEASRDVARAWGWQAQDLASRGKVTLVIVPHSQELMPTPSQELIEVVRDYVTARMSPLVTLEVQGPCWRPVEIEAKIVPMAIERASATRAAVADRLAAYLHPLYGGPTRRGWPFDRLPYRSELFAVIQEVKGVQLVKELRIAASRETADKGPVLACPGKITVILVERPEAGGNDATSKS